MALICRKCLIMSWLVNIENTKSLLQEIQDEDNIELEKAKDSEIAHSIDLIQEEQDENNLEIENIKDSELADSMN